MNGEVRLKAPNDWVSFIFAATPDPGNPRNFSCGKFEAVCKLPEGIDQQDLALFTIDRKDWINELDWPMLVFKNTKDMIYFKLKYL